MTEEKTTAKRVPARSRAKSVVTDVEQEVKKVAGVVAEDVKVAEAEVVKEVDVLEGKTVPELRILHDDALVAESEAKRLVHILRQRAVNEAVTIEIASEEAIIAAKKAWGEAVAWLQQVEKKLEGEFKDTSGIHKF